jgi:hypothetical protein
VLDFRHAGWSSSSDANGSIEINRSDDGLARLPQVRVDADAGRSPGLATPLSA